MTRKLGVRALRRMAFAGLSPLDRLALRVNGKGDFPPLRLRRRVGPLRSFESTAGEFVALLALLGEMDDASSVLDVGCGCGTVAILLRDRLGSGGRYHGIDVDAAAIDWCQRHLGASNFTFSAHDYWNGLYNRSGNRFQPLAVPEKSVDVVLMKSVLTHVLPEDLAFYLRETARVMRPSGTALLTAFTFSEVDEDVTALCPVDAGHYRYARQSAPEEAVAFRRDWLDSEMASAGLAYELWPGYWRSATRRAVSYQDVLAVKLAGAER